MKEVFKTLYQKSSDGGIKHWTMEVESVNGNGVMTARYGKDNSKIRIDTKTITIGKNIGSSNETTPYNQALSEAQSKYKKKLDKGYVEDKQDLDIEVLRPMLAHSFEKRGHNIKYPCYAQPKLDGVRCMAKKIDEKTIKYYSRMGKEFATLEHLTPDLLKCMRIGEVLDGEIYSHDMTFQELIRLIKKLRPESSKLEYHIFDTFIPDMSFEDRLDELAIISAISIKNPLIEYVPVEQVDAKEDVLAKHNEYVKQGYEGLILRNKKGKYKLNKRSADLQKYKVFQDEEFEIVGGKPGTGSDEGCVVFRVKNNKDEFSVRPRGSMEQRKEWMDNINKLIGKKLTVRFQELTDDGIPRFPVGISIRDYEN